MYEGFFRWIWYFIKAAMRLTHNHITTSSCLVFVAQSTDLRQGGSRPVICSLATTIDIWFLSTHQKTIPYRWWENSNVSTKKASLGWHTTRPSIITMTTAKENLHHNLESPSMQLKSSSCFKDENNRRSCTCNRTFANWNKTAIIKLCALFHFGYESKFHFVLLVYYYSAYNPNWIKNWQHSIAQNTGHR